MNLCDVNVLVYAFREGTPHHTTSLRWLETTVNSQTAFGMAELVLSGFLRIVTHPKIFDVPAPLDKAMEFVETLRACPNCIPITPGERHWTIFSDLCHRSEAQGNLIPDAYLAALAIESGCQWITFDRGFARFPGLRWSHPPAVE